MLTFEVENLKATLNKLMDPIILSLLNGKEVQVKPGVFVKLIGNLDFSLKAYNNGLRADFKIQPNVRVEKLITLHGTLTAAVVTAKGIELQIDGIPDVFLEAIS